MITSDETQGFKPMVIGFLCHWCSYAGADAAGTSRLSYPAEFRPIRVMCSGMVRPDLVLEAFRYGADGVLVMGCHPGECHYLEGNIKALARESVIAYTLRKMGIDAARFGLEWISAAEAAAFVSAVNGFITKIEPLGPLKMEPLVTGQKGTMP